MENPKEYKKVVNQLEAYIKRFYINKLLKGLLIYGIITFSVYLIFILGEHYFSFNSTIRKLIFFSFITLSITAIYQLVAKPILYLTNIKKGIDHKEASKDIGNYYKNAINDKVTNILQLAETRSEDALQMAAIEQKSTFVNQYDFKNIVNLKTNYTFLKVFIPVFLLLCTIGIVKPEIISESTSKIINYDVEYTTQPYFKFKVDQRELFIPRNSKAHIKIELVGNIIPEELFVFRGGKKIKLSKAGNKSSIYNYETEVISNNLTMQFYADGFYSKVFELKVFDKPEMEDLILEITPPVYTGLKKSKIENPIKTKIPQGSTIEFKALFKNTDSTFLIINDKEYKDHNNIKINVDSSMSYYFVIQNKFVEKFKGINREIKAIKDQRPKIKIDTQSIEKDKISISGTIADDYGFSNLKFMAKSKTAKAVQKLSFTNDLSQRFYIQVDIDSIGVNKGEDFEYYIVVTDNDQYNGYKSSISKKFNARKKSEIEKIEDKSKQNSKKENKLEKILNKVKELNKETSEVKEEILNKKELDWKSKNELEKLLEKQKELEKEIDSFKEDNKQREDEIDKRQEELDKLVDELLNDEMKELLKELEELMEQLNKEEAQKQLEEIEENNQTREKELDRTLELFKKLQVEQELSQISEQLDSLAKKQEELSNEKISDTSMEEQEKINKEFDAIKKQLEKTSEKNDENKKKIDLENTKEEAKETEKKLQESSESIEKKQNKKKQENQKQASDSMKKMSQDIKNKMSQTQSQQNKENKEDLRQLLNNVIQLSFEQEKLLNQLKSIKKDDPQYNQIGKKQKKLIDDSRNVEDSLIALAARVQQIQNVVFEKTTKINQEHKKIINSIGDRETSVILKRQQVVIKNYNDLALLLNEALDQMNQKPNGQPGDGSCDKPGGEKPSQSNIPSLKQLQDELGKQLEELKKGLKGKQPGGEGLKIPGKGKPGNGGDGKKLSELAKKQAQIKNEINKISKQQSEKGSKLGNELKKIADEMDKIEKDIINNNINNETYYRQQTIMTKLLEAENAEREQEYDDKREAEQSNKQYIQDSETFKMYQEAKEKETEFIQSIPIELRGYYKNKNNEYLNRSE